MTDFDIAGSETLAGELWQRFRREIPAYADIDEADTVPSLAAALMRLDSAVRERRELTEPEIEQFHEYGAIRARLGVPLEAVLRGWQIMIAEIIERVGRNQIWVDRPGSTLMNVLVALLRVSDAATVALSAGHRDTAAQIQRRRDGLRDDLMRGILAGRFGIDELRGQAQYLGLRLDQRYAAFRAISTEPEHTEWRIRQQPACRPPQGLTALLDGDVVGFFSGPTGPEVDDEFLGIGPRVELDELPRSIRIAGRVAETARLFARPGRHTLIELSMRAAVVGDVEVGAALAERYLESVRDDDASPILDTVECYLSAGMNASETANRMYLHHNTVRYRLARFEELTGVSLKDPEIAFQVWWALRYRELGWSRPNN